MNSRELICDAMFPKPTERIPVMPQICHDLSLYIRAAEEGTDVLDGYQECAERPEMVFEYVIDLVRRIRCFLTGWIYHEHLQYAQRQGTGND